MWRPLFSVSALASSLLGQTSLVFSLLSNIHQWLTFCIRLISGGSGMGPYLRALILFGQWPGTHCSSTLISIGNAWIPESSVSLILYQSWKLHRRRPKCFCHRCWFFWWINSNIVYLNQGLKPHSNIEIPSWWKMAHGIHRYTHPGVDSYFLPPTIHFEYFVGFK